MPGSTGTLAEKAKTAAGKGLEFLEARIEQAPIENQLKSAQTETEFLRQELLRLEIAKTAAETKGQELDNVTKQLDIQQRIEEITSGRTDIHVITDGEVTRVIFGNLPDQKKDGGQTGES